MSVYFVQAEIGGPVKIGYAVDPRKRLLHLQCGSPVKLALLRFAAGRLHGEWFAVTDELRALIDAPIYRNTEIIFQAPKARGARRSLPTHGPLVERHGRVLDALAEHRDWISAVPLIRRYALPYHHSSVTASLRSVMNRGWPVERRVHRAHLYAAGTVQWKASS